MPPELRSCGAQYKKPGMATRHEDEMELVPKGGATVAEGGTDAGADADGDAQKMDSSLQSTSSTYWALLIFSLIWWVGIFFFYLNVRSSYPSGDRAFCCSGWNSFHITRPHPFPLFLSSSPSSF